MEPHPLYQQILREHHLFATLADKQLTDLLEDSQVLHLVRGAYVFRQGDPCHSFGFIISGSLKVYRLGSDEQDKFFDVIGARCAFAEAMMFMDSSKYV